MSFIPAGVLRSCCASVMHAAVRLPAPGPYTRTVSTSLAQGCRGSLTGTVIRIISGGTGGRSGTYLFCLLKHRELKMHHIGKLKVHIVRLFSQKSMDRTFLKKRKVKAGRCSNGL